MGRKDRKLDAKKKTDTDCKTTGYEAAGKD